MRSLQRPRAWQHAMGLLCLSYAKVVHAQMPPPPEWYTPPPAGDHAQPATVDEDERWMLSQRANTYLGPVGGLHVVEASSGRARSLRVQLATDYFAKKDYLTRGDDQRYVGSALSLGITPMEHLELSGAVTMRRLRDADAEPGARSTLHTTGDSSFNIKGYGEVRRGVSVGGDATLSISTREPDSNVDYAGSSFGLRGNVSVNLLKMKPRLPLVLRANVAYVFDQTRKIVSHAERERLDRLVSSGRSSDSVGTDEVRQLATAQERLAYGVNRVDHAMIALGVEAPIRLSREATLQLLAEWEWWLPVNRQGYDCSLLQVPSSRQVGGQDRCLEKEGASAWPQRVSLGVRLHPGLAGLSLLAAAEIGITGTNDFVRELAPVAPYRLLFNAAYAFQYGRKPQL